MSSVLLPDLVRQAPALAVLAFIVVQFLRHLAARDSFMRELTNDCHRMQAEGHEVMRETKEALGAVRALLERLNGAP